MSEGEEAPIGSTASPSDLLLGEDGWAGLVALVGASREGVSIFRLGDVIAGRSGSD